jgi:hypothetical protein
MDNDIQELRKKAREQGGFLEAFLDKYGFEAVEILADLREKFEKENAVDESTE